MDDHLNCDKPFSKRFQRRVKSSSPRRSRFEVITSYLLELLRNILERLANLLFRRIPESISKFKMADVDVNESLQSSNIGKGGNFMCGVVEGFYGRPWSPEQRKDLFEKMNKFGINMYLYAPKDDAKHRAFWRDLYSVEEADQLSSLISHAKANNVTFYYALSPGLDITYSSAKEVTFLKRKLEQVVRFGCTAFALLFDDIEPDMCEADKEVFQSFAHAQVSITNEVYQHLGQPKFIFCPTEYCGTRAIPSVQNSEYLNTIGSKLLPEIDIMWTGSKVITKTITVQSIAQLTQVLRRPPVIWDNLHANDYDQKRLFLGPFTGRSPDLIPHLRGLFTNPNCEYEANFIPIHTLSQWSKCSVDGKRDLSLNDTISSDIRLETESDNGTVDDISSQINTSSYHPKVALKVAIKDWLPEFYRSNKARLKAPNPLDLSIPIVNTCISVTPTTTTTIASSSLNGINLPPIPLPIPEVELLTELTHSSFQQPINSLMSSTISLAESVEMMDCVPSPGSSPPNASELIKSNFEVEAESTDGCEQQLSAARLLGEIIDNASVNSENMTSSGKNRGKDVGKLTVNDIALLVDLFYLPFEHGSQGLLIMQELNWLKNNAHLVMKKGRSAPLIEAQEWYDRAKAFNRIYEKVCLLSDRLNYCSNRVLVHELYPYVWDMRGVISLLDSYVKWLALGHVPQTVATYVQGSYSWFSNGWKEAFMSGDQEPWVFRGGLTAELQRLLPLDNVNDLYIWKPPDVPSPSVLCIRPYDPKDKESVFILCRNILSNDTSVKDAYSDVFGESSIGGFLSLSSEFTFVVEENDIICGYAVAALDAKQFKNRMETVYMPELCLKYGEIKEDSQEMLTQAEALVANFHNYNAHVPEDVHKHFPSLVKVSISPSVSDSSIIKKLVSCTFAALKSNGSFGAYCEVNFGDLEAIDLYTKLGFLEISHSDKSNDSVINYGRAF
ncbi:hypothetical protein CHUAL_011182 [Chamberlinius hualienensis]